jgi:uncharacterized protein DUF998
MTNMFAMRLLASWSGIMGVTCLLLAAILGCAQFSEFNHMSQYLSELYAVGTPYGWELRFFLLVPGGILITLFGFLAGKEFPKSWLVRFGFAGVALFYGMSTIVGSAFPCDEGCTRELSSPSWPYIIHLSAGFLTHTLVPPSLLMIGIAARKWNNGRIVAVVTAALAAICFGCNLVLGADPLSEYAGLLQRIFEGAVVCWIALAAFFLQSSFADRSFERGVKIGMTRRRGEAWSHVTS